MYKQFFHLSAQPFSISPDPKFLYASQRHLVALAHLLYGIKIGGGFVVLTGEVGTGKTLLCQCLMAELPDNVDLALILNPRLDALELLASICDDLGIAYSSLSLKTLVDALNKHLLAAHAQGRQTVVMIDEAQNLSFEVLEQIRLLTNLETTTDKLLQIILVGQPELQDILKRPALRQLNQRITARYHLDGLDFNDARAYIRHRLVLCQGDPELFNAAAIKQIFRLTKGIPRLINRICDRALLGAYALGQTQIGLKIVNKAAEEAYLFSHNSPRRRLLEWSGWYLLSGLLCLLTGALLLSSPLVTWSKIEHKPINVVAEKPKPPVQKFDALTDILNEQAPADLSFALANVLALYGKIIDPHSLSCKAIEKMDLRCFLDRSSWKGVMALNRPVVLELELKPHQKSFVLLTGLSSEAAWLKTERERCVPINTLLQYWDGYYLVLWRPPFKDITDILPNTTNPAVSWLRAQFTSSPVPRKNTNFFDKALVQQVSEFQRQHGLLGLGIVRAKTSILIQNQMQNQSDPKLLLRD